MRYKMNVALIGYGKMGRMIHSLAPSLGVDVVSIIDPNVKEQKFNDANVYSGLSEETLADVSVCIDFSHPSQAVHNILKVLDFGKDMVVGTTGWYKEMSKVSDAVEDSNRGLIWSGNFSIGVNIYFEVLKRASILFNKFEEYDPYVLELHHNQKADSPSGTAQMIGDILIDNIDRKSKFIQESLNRKIEPEELHIASVRVGSITGEHVVGFDSEADSIIIKHSAKTRAGFAAGALHAAKWINGRKGFFSIEDMMKDLIDKS
ncbi:4-hydroxy-tetrahydrodipicolinate reductase [Candidatus Woesearchaeota archaeon]|nr:4-hydroxy-tetrahydrodipicolinate reductase [Candidatus Woesearchaeota archaeon]